MTVMNSDKSQTDTELKIQIARLASIVKHNQEVGITIKQLFGAIYAMLRWHQIGIDSKPDDPNTFLNALIEMEETNRAPKDLGLSGYYRNDATMRLSGSYERVCELVWRGKHPEKDKCHFRISEIKPNLKIVRECWNKIKHDGGEVEHEEVLEWPVGIAALKEIVDYIEENNLAIVAGYKRKLHRRKHTESSMSQ